MGFHSCSERGRGRLGVSLRHVGGGDHASRLEIGNNVGAVASLAEYLVGVLAQQRRSAMRATWRLGKAENGNSRDIELALRDGKITLGLVEGTTRQNTMHYIPFMKDELVVVTHVGSKLAAYDELTLEQLCALPVVLRENGSGTLEVLEGTLAKHQIKLSQLNVLLQLGSTESIKLFLENSDALGILSIRAVTRELMAGRLKVIEIEGFKAERTFSFVEPQGQNSGMEESFMRFASQHWQ